MSGFNLIKLICIFLLSVNLAFLNAQQQEFVEKAKNHLLNNSDINVKKFGSSDLKLKDYLISKHNGIHHLYFIQTWNGIEIFSADASVNLTSEGKILNAHSQLIASVKANSIISEPAISVQKALEQAAVEFGRNTKTEMKELKNTQSIDRESSWAYPILSMRDIHVKLRYQSVNESKLILCWDLIIEDPETKFWWNIRVDAQSGKIVDKVSWTEECNWGSFSENDKVSRAQFTGPMDISNFVANSYNVFELPKESPNDGSRSIVLAPWDNALNASPFGWHDTDGIGGSEFTITRGNNVFANEDTDANNIPGFSPDGGVDLEFDFPLNLSNPPSDYFGAAITNLFYWNNLTHDVWYQYGFDEASGNFQENNYGNGGLGSDYVNADAQDGSDTNNANFSTPPDGLNPRMQMFEWIIKNVAFNVNSPAGIAGNYFAAGAEFGPQTIEVTGELVLSDPALGCETLDNPEEIADNIAVIDRGDCFFIEKVLNAQNAGAIAVIICNNVPGSPITMAAGGSTNPSDITIPSVMLSQNNCNTIKAELPGVNATIDIEMLVNRDSDLDNGIIVHEYGHGISNRLTGGPSNVSCLGNEEQMGEGWSDWFARMMTIKPGDAGEDAKGVGNYVSGEGSEGNGIRQFPYSTDLAVNPHTYEDISGVSIPHGVGSVWAAMLWEMTWELIEAYGFDPDLYEGTGGNNLAMQLVIDGLKLQPCSPGFVDGRDAILMADEVLTGGANQCLIWKAFAKRGLGFSASQGLNTVVGDETEAFDVPLECQCSDGVQNGDEEGVDCGGSCPDVCTESCPETLTYQDTEIPHGTDDYVENWIKTVGTVNIINGSSVQLTAGQYVEFGKGFTSSSDSDLSVNIGNCPDSFSQLNKKSINPPD